MTINELFENIGAFFHKIDNEWSMFWTTIGNTELSVIGGAVVGLVIIILCIRRLIMLNNDWIPPPPVIEK